MNVAQCDNTPITMMKAAKRHMDGDTNWINKQFPY
jgi:hypothetical protein